MKIVKSLLLSIGLVSTLVFVVICIALTRKIGQFLPLAILVLIVVIMVAAIIYEEF